MSDLYEKSLSKVPEVTLVFWLIKIAATTLGETGGDAVTMSMHWGYLWGTALFGLMFVVMVAAQTRARSFHPGLYWLTIVATTTVGTTIADFVDRSLGIGYAGGSSMLFLLLLLSLFLWYRVMGTVAATSINSPRSEAFYWTTIMFSQTLGTALGDWTADTAGLGYTGALLLFGGVLLVAAMLFAWTRLSRTLLFWVAFVMTRPLGAVLGDFLDKPVNLGGLDLSRFGASAVLILCMLVLMWFFKQYPASLNQKES